MIPDISGGHPMHRLAAAAIAALALTGAAGAASAQDVTGAALVDYVFSELEAQFGIAPASGATGRLAAGASTTGTFTVTSGAAYIVIGACDEGCSDIDLVVRDSSGNEVGRDEEDDDAPMVVIPAGSGGRYTFEAQMVTCTSNCHFGVRSYNAGS
jgi:hypothetical protein